MQTEIKYSDGLVTITNDELIFHSYYLTGNDKGVPVDNIEKIEVRKPTIWNGKWRLWGTGNFKTWFPQDIDRPKRDRIFFAKLRNQWVQIGFTARDSYAVEDILRQMQLIKE